MPLATEDPTEAPARKEDRFVSQRVPADKLAEFMALARDRYAYAKQIDDEDRKLALSDADFAVATPRQDAGTSQWDAGEAAKRIGNSRPCLTENRLPTFTAQVVNDGRQRKPAIKITPMDNGTKETAQMIQGRIRQIEYESNADIAYDTSREQQVTCGRGFLRVTWEFVPRSVRKKRARVEPIPNQFSVLFGPSKEYDCSDAEYCFVISYITVEEHKRQHGTDTTAAHTDFAGLATMAPDWFGTGPNARMIQKAEYWVREFKPRLRCLLTNGQECWQDELPEDLEARGITIEETRVEQDVTVVQYVIDGADILGETEFIGPYIGIVPVWGREWFVDGKRRTSSLIRYAKDPQRLLNLYVSNIAEQIAQMPKTPWWIPTGGVPAGMEAVMLALNTDPRSFAYYNQWDIQGRALNAPSRVVNEPPIMALVTGYNQAVDAIKAAMGLFDASIGAISNETSGVAIGARKRESDNANFHFHDNEGRTRNHVGRILLYMIAEFDKEGDRAVRGEDGKVHMVTIGKPYRDEALGKDVHHNLQSADDYGVSVDTGPGYTSQRQEGFDTLIEMASKWPALLQIGGPTILRASDIPGADQLADLMEKTLAPELRSDKSGAKGQAIPPELAAKFQQVQQQAGAVIDGLTQEVQRLQEAEASQRVQMEFKLRIVEMQEATKKEIALAELNQTEGLTVLKQDLLAVKHQLDLQQDDADRQHAADQADLQRQHQKDMASQPPPQPAAAPGNPGEPGSAAPAPPAGTGEPGSAPQPPEPQPQSQE